MGAELKIERRQGGHIVVHCSGAWEALHLDAVVPALDALSSCGRGRSVEFDLSKATRLDSVAATALLRVQTSLERCGGTVTFTHDEGKKASVLQMVRRYGHPGSRFDIEEPGIFEQAGRTAVNLLEESRGVLDFIGHTFVALWRSLLGTKPWRFKETLYQIDESAIKALWIIGLTMFLVGIVVAYQSAIQLRTYGANIFIVDMMGISILRELAPMLTAIIVAGRSGSAFAAQIGVMKLTEEIDAMRTMGFDPYAYLVLPRMIALIVMMPILIFFADMFGMLGGMLVAKAELGISSTLFLERFASVVHIKHFVAGVVKGPFFAVIIAGIGIYRGLGVKNDTESIGINTTRSVVESIFTVIICDALFSIVFTNLGF